MTSNTKSDKLSLGGKLELKTDGGGRGGMRGGASVQVEVKKKKLAGGPTKSPRRTAAAPTAAAPAEPVTKAAPRAEAKPKSAAGKPRMMLRSLTDEEKAARERAVKEAVKADAQARRQAEEDAKRQAEEDARRAEEEAAQRTRQAEEEARKQAEEQARKKAEEEAARRLNETEGPAPSAPPARPSQPVTRDAQGPRMTRPAPVKRPAPAAPSSPAAPPRGRAAEEEDKRRKGPGAPKRPGPGRGAGDQRRRSNRISLDDEYGQSQRQRSAAAMRRAREKEKRAQQDQGDQVKITREVTIPEVITVQELANRMAERGAAVVKALFNMGVMATINQSIDADTAELLVTEFGHTPKRVSDADVEDGLGTQTDADDALLPRAPVVTVMGHVDHGKTSLLDALRKTRVVAGEAGGITQHIGAYQVETEAGDPITFIDTPGHAAFTSMRSRGAKVTDVVILVVAADDGVMPQTVEAINHAKAAEVPMIVAINKMDKPEADPNRVRTELLQHEVIVEAMSGEVQDVEVSAVGGQGLQQLIEAIQLQSEILELKANPERPGEGVVVEAQLDKGRGAVGTVLVQRGTLRMGDIFVAGRTWGRVRALIDDHGENVAEAGPSVPVEVLGLQGTPEAGDELVVVDSEARAREIVEYRERKERDQRAARGARGTLEQMFTKISEGEATEVPVVIKADVQGSSEAIVQALEKLGTDEVRVRVLHSGVGGITESDITLAAASEALVFGFNVRANAQAREQAKQNGVDLRYYSIIYDLTDDMKQIMSGLLAPEERETLLGYADVLEVFSISKVGKIAGCLVTEGMAKRGARVRQLRDDVVVYAGAIETLKRFKDDVKDVPSGQECGIAFEANQDIVKGDKLEIYEVTEVKRSIDD